ncbi:hypothetical protein PR202_gb08779 [Eleusine coracana subsp. coracana]|uniref:Uncharacterized protein n=1 Tax=Eleusine coracana subsp. coracana TaxID=191504 RepID=A0AAV5ED37_ELECO|nr:hypothetical protein PR202_gb08779 [Eleusine coracana subsp. coracana]
MCRLLPRALAVHPAPCPAPPAAGVAVSEVIPVLQRAISSGDVLRLGRAVHALLIKTALTSHTLLSNRLVELYSLLPSPDASVAAFHDLPHKNSHSYNTLSRRALPWTRHPPDALKLFDEMPADLRKRRLLQHPPFRP